MPDELIKLFKKAAISAIINEGVPGVVGKADGTIFYTTPAGVRHYNRVWARIGEGNERVELVVHAPNISKQWNMPIIIADRGGTPTAVKADWLRASVFTGGRVTDVPQHAWTHQRTSIDPLYIQGQAFIPLMARPTNPPDMTVTVEHGFYRYKSTEKVLTQTVSASLTSFKPDSAALVHYIILCLNREDNNLFIIDGDDVITLTLAIVVAKIANLEDRYFPIAAIQLHQAQTAIHAYDIFYDMRLWGGEGFDSGGADFSLIMTDDTTAIMVDANGNVMVGI